MRLRELIRDDLGGDLRVALVGSGGLSHEPGGARYFKIDEAFDRRFIELCVKGDHRTLIGEMTPERMEDAGRGGTPELYTWFAVMGATAELPGETFGYSAWTSFRCGFGAVVWDMTSDPRHAAGATSRDAPSCEPHASVAGARPNKAWEGFDPTLASHDLVQDLKWDRKLRLLFEQDEAAVLDRYGLLPAERNAIEDRDFRALYDLGMHPYLGGQLSRFIWGNDAAKGAVEASNKLVASLQGHTRDIPKMP
jgi:hypothetical protein